MHLLLFTIKNCDPQAKPTTVNALVGNFLRHKTKTKLRGLSPHANYTDRAAAAGRRS